METFIGIVFWIIIIYFWLKYKENNKDDVTYYDKHGNKTGSKRYRKRH